MKLLKIATCTALALGFQSAMAIAKSDNCVATDRTQLTRKNNVQSYQEANAVVNGKGKAQENNKDAVKGTRG